MTDGHCFISYSNADGLSFASQLANDLQGRHPNVKVWFDKNDLNAGEPWDTQIAEAIRACKCLVLVMTDDSVTDNSVCKDEWTWALKYKKPIIPLHFHPKADLPFRLNNLQYIEFARDFTSGISQLRERIADLDFPKGILAELKHRLADANRDLRRAKDDDKLRIQTEIEELTKQIETQENIVKNPKAAEEQTKKNIQSGLERERQPEKPISGNTVTRFINPPPGIAPNYFQDRSFETKQVVDFLKNDAQRMMTIVGRSGVGKTAMICRLLKGLEIGKLPDDLGTLKTDGVVYLSESGRHRINFVNIFYDLCKLIPAETAQELDTIYKNPQASTESKMRALLESFRGERVVLLLDNFEPLVDTETFAICDSELDESLRTFLNGIHTSVKIIITTRIAPRTLNLLHHGRQRVLTLDEGLDSPYAENILREMDSDKRIGLNSASEALLRRARERTRGYPRALEALFAILASDRYTTLEEVLDIPTPENVVEVLVGEAFNRLDTGAQKVMQALAVYNRPVPPAAVDYLLSPHIPSIDSAPILQRLANMHFARKESGRFYLHPVDREYAIGLLPKGNVVSFDNPEKIQFYTQVGLQLPRKKRTDFTRTGLTDHAANYFAQARKPLAELKSLDDISAQLAEFDLRCAAGDYDSATDVLTDIDFDYLILWGHYRLMVELHLQVKGKIIDKNLRMANLNGLGFSHYGMGKIKEAISFYKQGLQNAREAKDRQAEGALLGNLGSAYANLGDLQNAIDFYEQALAIAQEIGDHRNKGVWLGNLGNRYAELGDTSQAIKFYEQALEVRRVRSDRRGESIDFENTGHVFLALSDYQKAKENYQRALQIADEISLEPMKQYARCGLAQVHLFQNDVVNACGVIESALHYDVPQNNHNTSALYGIIVLRQRDVNTAYQAFMRALAQADEILAKTPDFYEALDAKGLALCGLAICDDKKYNTDAIEVFHTARKIAPHTGVVKRVLRLFDELVKCDNDGILKDVRKALEGK